MMVGQAVCIFLLFVVLAGLIPHYWFPGQYRRFLWLLAGLNILVAVALFFRMPESPRWLEARERRDQARKVVERMEARVMKRHPVLPEPDLTPYEVVAEEKTSWFAPFGRQYVVVTVFLLVVMVLGYGGIVYGGASQVSCSSPSSRGYSAGFVFALTAWAGVAATAVYLLNAFFGDRFERKWTQLVGAIMFAGGWWGIYAVHSTPALVRLLHRRDCRRHAVAVEHVRVHTRQLPDPDALAGHRLDRRRRPPRRLGRRPDRRSALQRGRAAGLHLVHHDPVRAPPRLHGRDLREDASAAARSKNWPGRRWAAGSIRPPTRGVSTRDR